MEGGGANEGTRHQASFRVPLVGNATALAAQDHCPTLNDDLCALPKQGPLSLPLCPYGRNSYVWELHYLLFYFYAPEVKVPGKGACPQTCQLVPAGPQPRTSGEQALQIPRPGRQPYAVSMKVQHSTETKSRLCSESGGGPATEGTEGPQRLPFLITKRRGCRSSGNKVGTRQPSV